MLITSPDAMHRDDTLLALRHGKAVLCEKPVAMNAAEAEEMQAAAQGGRDCSMAWRRTFVSTEAWSGCGSRSPRGESASRSLPMLSTAYPAAQAPRKWITDPTLACGGPIADVGVHCIDALRFVLGEDVVSVSTLAQKDGLSGKVEAIASLQLEMTGGVYANVTASARALYRTLVEVTGSDGVLVAENGLTVDRPVELAVRRGGELVETVTVENGDGYTRMLDSFARAFRGEGSFPASGEDAIAQYAGAGCSVCELAERTARDRLSLALL